MTAPVTDNFLQKFEEKVVNLLTELESLRKEVVMLKQENTTVKAEKANYVKKLQGLISLFDSLNAPVPHETNTNEVHHLRPATEEEASAVSA